MKFTPEEMAIDAADVDASKPVTVARGRTEWLRFVSFRRGYVRLDADLREAFPDDASVNAALRKVVEIQKLPSSGKRRKSA